MMLDLADDMEMHVVRGHARAESVASSLGCRQGAHLS
ncbi:hypothetical protein L916_20077 [Phytophthora nicotianae]|uniref:Uncharacterized protein n=1 Tax=Phytophthora nicotianae TaxID=4792 RepID=W2HYJ5_PHYNI|nr:hypothetical protein L916_20077 [Phytophthora nicotianae]